jgi:hypothetical protein
VTFPTSSHPRARGSRRRLSRSFGGRRTTVIAPPCVPVARREDAAHHRPTSRVKAVRHVPPTRPRRIERGESVRSIPVDTPIPNGQLKWVAGRSASGHPVRSESAGRPARRGASAPPYEARYTSSDDTGSHGRFSTTSGIPPIHTDLAHLRFCRRQAERTPPPFHRRRGRLAGDSPGQALHDPNAAGADPPPTGAS